MNETADAIKEVSSENYNKTASAKNALGSFLIKMGRIDEKNYSPVRIIIDSISSLLTKEEFNYSKEISSAYTDDGTKHYEFSRKRVGTAGKQVIDYIEVSLFDNYIKIRSDSDTEDVIEIKIYRNKLMINVSIKSIDSSSEQNGIQRYDIKYDSNVGFLHGSLNGANFIIDSNMENLPKYFNENLILEVKNKWLISEFLNVVDKNKLKNDYNIIEKDGKYFLILSKSDKALDKYDFVNILRSNFNGNIIKSTTELVEKSLKKIEILNSYSELNFSFENSVCEKFSKLNNPYEDTFKVVDHETNIWLKEFLLEKYRSKNGLPDGDRLDFSWE